jgi:hypothetical protein
MMNSTFVEEQSAAVARKVFDEAHAATRTHQPRLLPHLSTACPAPKKQTVHHHTPGNLQSRFQASENKAWQSFLSGTVPAPTSFICDRVRHAMNHFERSTAERACGACIISRKNPPPGRAMLRAGWPLVLASSD